VDFEDVVRFLTLFASAVPAGAFLMMGVTEGPAVTKLGPEKGPLLSGSYEPRVNALTRLAAVVAAAAGVAVLLADGDLDGTAVGLTVAGIVAVLAALAGRARALLALAGFACLLLAVVAGGSGDQETLRVINVLAAGLAAGIVTAVVAGQIPAVRALGEATGLEARQHIDRVAHFAAPPMLVIALITGIVLLVTGDDLPDGAGALTLAGALLSVAGAVPALGVNAPINVKMQGWSPAEVPAEYGPLNARWSAQYTAGAVAVTLSFACFAAAAIAVVYG
jgi:hypothetical protein